MGQLYSTATGAVTGCVPNWQWDNCIAPLQGQSQVVFPTGNGTTVSTTTGAVTSCVPNFLASSLIYPNQHSHTLSSYINRTEERKSLSSEMCRPAVRQTDANVSKKLCWFHVQNSRLGCRQIIRNVGMQHTPDAVELLKSVILTTVAV